MGCCDLSDGVRAWIFLLRNSRVFFRLAVYRSGDNLRLKTAGFVQKALKDALTWVLFLYRLFCTVGDVKRYYLFSDICNLPPPTLHRPTPLLQSAG